MMNQEQASNAVSPEGICSLLSHLCPFFLEALKHARLSKDHNVLVLIKPHSISVLGRKGIRKTILLSPREFRSPGRQRAREHSELLPRSLFCLSLIWAHCTSADSLIQFIKICQPGDSVTYCVDLNKSRAVKNRPPERKKRISKTSRAQQCHLAAKREMTNQVWSLQPRFVPGLHDLSL